ncbi:MAG: helix-turn-helix domain-containing protein [Clostridia bacterium]|nr:helix-turn-helix domain-containing protein [Clostridia bacterium]
MQNIIAKRIQTLRREHGLTQEELAEQLGVTFQAVSKWETGKAAPDIILLPLLADIFDCPIDDLFARKSKLVTVVEEPHYDLCTEFPWADDEVLRGVVCQGRKILQKTDGLVDRFTFEVKGEIRGGVRTECNLAVYGDVSGGTSAGNNTNVWGGISGGVHCGDNLAVHGNISGGVNCGGALAVQNGISGGVSTAGDITCRGDITGKVTADGDINVTGNIKADKVTAGADITCHHLECEKAVGNIRVDEEEEE